MKISVRVRLLLLSVSCVCSAAARSAALDPLEIGSGNSPYLASVVLPPSSEAVRAYDAKGRVATKWQNGVQTRNFYRNGRRVAAIRSDGATARYVYYKNGLLKQIAWSDGAVQSVIYNKQTHKVIGVYSNLGARLAVTHDTAGKVHYVATVNNQPVASALTANTISELTRHHPKMANRRNAPGQAAAVAVIDGDEYDGGGGGGGGGSGGSDGGSGGGGSGGDGWGEAPDDGSGGYEDAPAVDDTSTDATPIVHVEGVSCSTDPSQDACQDPSGGDAADAIGDMPSGEPPTSSPAPGWHGPKGCAPTPIVQQCKDDVYASYEKTIATVCKKMLTTRGRQQCYAEQATLLGDQLRQCEETLLCRDE